MARLQKLRFYLQESMLDFVSGGRPLKVLLTPKPKWEKRIRTGFKCTRHRLVFAEPTEQLLKHCDLVIPLDIDFSRALCHRKEELGTKALLIPPAEALELCDDKIRCNQALKQHGFGQILPAEPSPGEFPYVLKKRVDSWSTHSHIIENSTQEIALADKLADPDYFCQSLISGELEYSTHILFLDGEIQHSLTVQRTFPGKQYLKGKVKDISRRLVSSPYLDDFAQILRSIGYEGLAGIDHKVVNGRPMVFEINPRCGGSATPYLFSFLRQLPQT